MLVLPAIIMKGCCNTIRKIKTFTAKYRPWVLKAVFYVGQDRGKAMMMEKYINPNYSQIFYSKPKLPAIIENARNLFSSKLSNNSFAKKPLRFPILLVFWLFITKTHE